MSRRGAVSLALVLAAFATGCSKSSAPLGGKPAPRGAAAAQGKTAAKADAALGAPKGWQPAEEDGKSWVGYPNVPYVPVMSEVEGIEVPRVTPDPGDFGPGAKVQADTYNPAARGKASEPVTGGTLTMRVEAEPNSLNPITDSSAYGQFFNTLSQSKDGLLWQNWETFAWEPHIAERWLVEDSVKVRPDFAGRERKVALDGGKPSAKLSLEVKADAEGQPRPVVLRTSDGSGRPVGRSWVGFRPSSGKGEVEHFWSDEKGRLEAAPAPGSYDVLVGDELVGELTEEGDDYVFKSLTDASTRPVSLAKTDVIDVQRKTVFTYYLRDDVTWSDGRPFTSKDLEFGYAAINNPFVDGDSVRVYYADVVECRGLDPHTVRLKYRRQYFQAIDYTSGLALYTPPLHVFERFAKEQGRTLVFDHLSPEEENARSVWSVHGQQFGRFFNEEDRYNRKPVGYGPYVVSEWSQQDKRLVLERRKDYWNQEHAGHLDRIVVKFIEDAPTAVAALRAGEIDLLWRPTAEQFFKELIGDWVERSYVKGEGIIPSFSYVGWNMRKPMFQDRRVRLALAMLFDKRQFFEKFSYGAGVLVSGSQYFYGPQYDHSVKSVGYDPQAARDLLAEAGWIDTDGDGLLDQDAEPFRFTMMVPPGNPTTGAMIEVMQRNYRGAGIDVDVLQLEWASYLEKIKSRQFDVCTMAWLSSPESDPFQIWHGSQADPKLRSSNHVGFQNAEADRLIERIRITLDPEERRRLFYSFHRILDSEQPYDFLWTRREFVVYHQKFRGVKMYALRPGFDLREWYIPKDLQ